MNRVAVLLVALLVVTIGALGPVTAEERYKKWSIELAIGGNDPQDEVRSNANNTAVFIDPDDGRQYLIDDPRPTTNAQNAMTIDSATRIDFRVGYGLLEFGWGEFILDSGIAYIDTTISGMELSYNLQYRAGDPLDEDNSPTETGIWQTEFLPVGDLKQIPVSIDGILRFRPTKRMNPYVGLGLGYRFVEFKEDPTFTEWMEFLDASVGHRIFPTGDGNTGEGPLRDIKRARVDAPNTFFYLLRLGVEWQLHPKWSIYLDTRYEWADEAVTLSADGGEELGRSTPNGETDILWPRRGAPFYTLFPGENPQGVQAKYPDRPGDWYLQGGKLDYGGWNFSLGVRFSF
jgi:opacity protein-like surface antigen